MKRKGFEKVLSVILVCILLLSQGMISGFAAADPKENTVIQLLTDGWDDPKRAGGIINDFSTIDEDDTTHGKVNWFSYNKNSTMAASKVWSAEVAKPSKDKMVSFDLYIYDNTIPYEIRFCNGNSSIDKTLGEINVNFTTTTIGSGMATVNTNAKISVNAGTTEVASLKNKQWHKVDVIFSEGKCDYYINGEHIGSNNHGITDAYFTGYQIVSRHGNQAATTKNSGIYIDNFRSVVSGDDAQFYGKATLGASSIKIEFSETISSSYSLGFAGVTVYNTKSEAALTTGTPVLSGTTLTIPISTTLISGVEYVVSFPNKPVGISGKKLYSDVYFYVPAGGGVKESSIIFDDYPASPSNNSTDIIAVDSNWIRDKLINIKDADNAAHKKVVYAAATKVEKKYRWGIKSEDDIDTTKGEASVQFDVKIPDHYYEYLVIQPYSTVSEKTPENLVDAGSLSTDAAMTGLKNHFCSFTIMGETFSKDYTKTNNGNPYIVFDTDSDTVHASKEATATNEDLKIVSLAKDDWHTIKVAIDNSKSDTVVKLYVDGTLQATNTGVVGGKDLSKTLKGVRFALKSYAEENASEKIWIDNVKFTYVGDEENHVKKVRIYDLDGNDYGPMATNVPASAERAEITLTESISSADGVTVCATDGENTIESQVTLSSDGTVLTAIFDEVLKPDKYTINVSGTGFEAGAASFTFVADDEVAIYNLRITDANGTKLTAKPTATGTYYVKAKVINATAQPATALILGAVYNNKAMDDVNFTQTPLAAYSKTEEDVVVTLNVSSLDNLEISAMAWEDFVTCKPIIDAITY